MDAYKISLSTKKVVMLRKIKIKDYELATQSACTRLPKDAHDRLVDLAVSSDLLKMLILTIDGNKPKAIDLEDLDKLFDETEYLELMTALGEIRGVSGNAKSKKATVEFIVKDSGAQ